MQLLLEKGADIHAHGGFLGNALYTASKKGHIEIVQLLLEKGANVNAQGPDGSALDLALMVGVPDCRRGDRGEPDGVRGGDEEGCVGPLRAAGATGVLTLVVVLATAAELDIAVCGYSYVNSPAPQPGVCAALTGSRH